jgi:hypothetical protein
LEWLAVSEFFQMLDAAVSGLAADVAFGLIVLVSVGMLLLAILFFLLAVRGVWRFLTRHTMNDVVRSAERKALLAGKASQGSR